MTRSAWETATGHEAECGRLVRSTVRASDELAEPTGSPADADGAKRQAHGHFGPKNTIGKDKKIRSGPRGALAALESQGDPAARATVKWGRRYGAHRRAELASCHGGELSAGVGTIVESAADLMADARYWRARGVAEGNPEYYKLASQLMAQARGCERDAWELAAREAEARRKTQPAAVPSWLQPAPPQEKKP